MIIKDDLDATIENLKAFSWHSLTEDQMVQVKHDFKEALGLFIAANYLPKEAEEYDTLMCSIHDAFPSHHTCVGCNLQAGTRAIERFLLRYQSFDSAEHDCAEFIMHLYLVVEKVHTYLELITIPQAYRARHFQVFQEVKYWANFLKHPKSFMLVLHPMWSYEGLLGPTLYQDPARGELVIDSAFTKEYYSGDKKNLKLYDILARRDNVVVRFPNPVKLTKQFMRALQKFVSIIAENEMVREMLESETMVKRYFSAEAQDESQDDKPEDFMSAA